MNKLNSAVRALYTKGLKGMGAQNTSAAFLWTIHCLEDPPMLMVLIGSCQYGLERERGMYSISLHGPVKLGTTVADQISRQKTF